MNLWSKTEIKRFIERSKKDCLIIDMENGFLSNGIVIYKINDELKQILKDMFITQSFYFRDGKELAGAMDLKPVYEKALKNCQGQELKLIPFYYESKNMKSTFFISENEKFTMLINPLFLKPFNQTLVPYILKYYCSDAENYSVNIMVVKHLGEPVACILPQRNTLKYKIVKNFESGYRE